MWIMLGEQVDRFDGICELFLECIVNNRVSSVYARVFDVFPVDGCNLRVGGSSRNVGEDS